MKTTILLADDHPVVRDGLRLAIDAQIDLEVIGEVDNGLDAVQQAVIDCPNVVVMDITMPKLNGIEATRQILEVCPETRVIVLSMHASTKHILWSLQAGAMGYLLKGSASSEVITAIRSVSAGRRYLSHKVAEQIGQDQLHHLETKEVDNPLAPLSPREREVLQLVVEGKSSAEIAKLLYLSVKTVETYRYRLMQKLNINDLPGLVKFAIQNGLTPLE
ncbi:MAG: response regulator transcription factor [Anaerolineae bacterium]|nr:response regulator transcription factor [Anaerolineae bacterium]MCB0179232.1 response regulator transcription factor [Anaerolineae bacterium]MCB9106152.1 response regulator transcription factor [Anaerolineales bacterium]